ncbi:hypothetical protein CPB83DRAFT_842359 [Crepidotus variabilis]|uniref:DUF7704 domain-containing protein n=1 Tax=Crepidotus variabilis TaxID=179855 RepID=A0A9P6EVB9_9AGAR|nr:hypothetical protein CPB83DRAFT_842359 [Crepidotus variabilis]
MTTKTDTFPALTGLYHLIFLHIEPGAILLSVIAIWIWPGASWFHHELVPAPTRTPIAELDTRTHMAMLQLSNCYFLLMLISSVVFRAIRDTLPDNPVAQERILGAGLTALAIADLTHVFATLWVLPSSLRYSVLEWNGTTHGNTTITLGLFLFRMAWFLGIGRKRYYYGQPSKPVSPVYKQQ